MVSYLGTLRFIINLSTPITGTALKIPVLKIIEEKLKKKED
jgi:hypothetical protein